jgi:hypothetical protein
LLFSIAQYVPSSQLLFQQYQTYKSFGRVSEEHVLCPSCVPVSELQRAGKLMDSALTRVEVQFDTMKDLSTRLFELSTRMIPPDPHVVSVVQYDDPCFLSQLRKQTQKISAYLATHTQTNEDGEVNNATSYTKCILSRLPAAFFDPPSDEITANETLHSMYIYHKHRALLELTKPYCELRLVSFVCEGWCGGTGDRNKGLVTAIHLALLTHSQFSIRWVNPIDAEEYFYFPTMAVTVPPAELHQPLETDNQRVYKFYSQKYSAAGKREEHQIDSRGFLTGVEDINK